MSAVDGASPGSDDHALPWGQSASARETEKSTSMQEIEGRPGTGLGQGGFASARRTSPATGPMVDVDEGGVLLS